LSIEPPTPEHPLINHDRIVITPHTAGVTEQSFSALGHAVADNIARLKRGKTVKEHRVTKNRQIKFDTPVKSLQTCHSRESGSPELFDFTGFPFSRE